MCQICVRDDCAVVNKNCLEPKMVYLCSESTKVSFVKKNQLRFEHFELYSTVPDTHSMSTTGQLIRMPNAFLHTSKVDHFGAYYNYL